MGRVARRVAVALGSNLGHREAHLHHAIRRLRSVLDDLRVSSFHDTAPWGVEPDQPRYLNAAAVGVTPAAPRALLDALIGIEAERGRDRPRPLAPRTLDLDLILCGDDVVNEPDLVVPHPRFRERAFVLEPLAEVAPDLVDPVTGLTVEQLLARLSG
jgi:2-amino-4-hydroxy-6-hydroxymethyldihydropteridine diphosphokinase